MSDIAVLLAGNISDQITGKLLFFLLWISSGALLSTLSGIIIDHVLIVPSPRFGLPRSPLGPNIMFITQILVGIGIMLGPFYLAVLGVYIYRFLKYKITERGRKEVLNQVAVV